MYYADKNILEYNIIQEFSALIMQNPEPEEETKVVDKTESDKTKRGGANHSPNTNKSKQQSKQTHNKNANFQIDKEMTK